ncbi:hypothetical protein [Vibrio sonorensis]|uniref:hypothetical protein n=1 Tax=Vibrio sonorensis TaxID=1004316 RepID=UPI0008DA9404|nr:hypothetical protein [Vibrio sonorensis]
MSEIYRLVIVKSSGEKDIIEFTDLKVAQQIMAGCRTSIKDFESAFIGGACGKIYDATFPLTLTEATSEASH